MKEKRISELLMALCFAGFLSLILVTTVLLAQIKTAYYENRSLAGIPELTAESVLNGAFFDGFDHAPGRQRRQGQGVRKGKGKKHLLFGRKRAVLFRKGCCRSSSLGLFSMKEDSSYRQKTVPFYSKFPSAS